MRTARSARAGVALGATLIACSLAGISNAEQTSSSANGISVGDTQGISVGDILGISVGDTAGISVGDVQGISVGDTAGISVGDAQGISVGDTAGISVGDTAGISVGDVQGISVGDTSGISVGDAQGISVGDSSVLAGPVERIDIVNGVFHSMGQVVMASKDMLIAMRVGDFVTVDGSVVSPGWLYADAIAVSDITYVPGATKVFVSGMLSEIDVSTGTARLGDLTIDYTASLAIGRAPSGSMWAFAGTRPQSDGVLMSDQSGAVR